MDAIVNAAVSYSLSQEEDQITLEDLEKAFVDGARWMVEDKTEKKSKNANQNKPL